MAKSKKKQEKTKALNIAPTSRLAFGGMMPKPSGTQEAEVNKFVNAVARVYGVPALGVNVMGDKPYLNKEARLFLLHDLRKSKNGLKAIRTDFLKISTGLTEPSICKVTLVFKDGHEVEGIGEASSASVKLDVVKQTLNMMAETRAMNRAIWKEVAGDVWDRVSDNLGRMDMTDDERSKVIDAGRVSYEEVQRPDAKKPVPSSTADLEEGLRRKVENCKNPDDLIEIDERLQQSKLYSPKFKKELHEIINAKVDSLGK